MKKKKIRWGILSPSVDPSKKNKTKPLPTNIFLDSDSDDWTRKRSDWHLGWAEINRRTYPLLMRHSLSHIRRYQHICAIVVLFFFGHQLWFAMHGTMSSAWQHGMPAALQKWWYMLVLRHVQIGNVEMIRNYLAGLVSKYHPDAFILNTLCYYLHRTWALYINPGLSTSCLILALYFSTIEHTHWGTESIVDSLVWRLIKRDGAPDQLRMSTGGSNIWMSI